MITTNVIARTFQVECSQKTGTCFSLDIDQRQYLITARHIVEGINNNNSILIFHDGKWKTLDVELVWLSETEEDIAILAPSIQISPALPLIPSMDGVIYGQDVFFLGFPFGLKTEAGPINRNFPLPFIKKGVFSTTEKIEGGSTRIYIDGHNNPGFSGGPIIFTDLKTNEIKVLGVMSGYYPYYEPVQINNSITELKSQQNTGIAIAYSLDRAVEYIKENPAGVPLDLKTI